MSFEVNDIRDLTGSVFRPYTLFMDIDKPSHLEMREDVVESGYLRTRISFFEDAYKSQFSDWSEFFIAYSKHQLPNNNNLDYDEWAFLCGQMLYEQTESSPPNICLDSKEKPESFSGFSFWRTAFVRSKRLFQ